MRAVSLLFMCSLCIATGLNGTDNALVELVKQNLRRNNDDYADPNHYVINTTTTIKNKSTNARRVLFIEVSKDKYNQKETVTTEIVKTKKVGNDDVVATENDKATPSYKLKEESNVTNATNSNSIKSKKGARNRVETFDKFIKKNKDLFKDFTSKKFEQVQNIQFAQRQKKKMERNGKMSGEYIPDPNLLDMAPAKGARIENKRLQGRLCDRNVLIPEGPKYDGRGRSYRAGHPPPHTAPPHLVLPRCCNCCKKSVLGCE